MAIFDNLENELTLHREDERHDPFVADNATRNACAFDGR